MTPNLTEIEVELGDLKVRVSRARPPAGPRDRSAPAPLICARRQPPSPRARPGQRFDVSKNAVTSPMVGTAYLAPVTRRQGIHRGRPEGQGRPRRC